MQKAEQLDISLILCGAVLVMGGCPKQVTDRDIEVISLDETRTLYALQRRDPGRKIAVFIDPRASKDYREGHIPGARNLHLPTFRRGGGRDPELAAFQHIIVYGENPGDYYAPGVVKRLLELNYDGVRFFAGGLAAWSRVYSLESSPEPEEAEASDGSDASDGSEGPDDGAP